MICFVHMPTQIPVSETRKRLSELLKELARHPDKVFEITVNDTVLGELSAPSSKVPRIGTGDALLKALNRIHRKSETKIKTGKTARQHDFHLYFKRK